MHLMGSLSLTDFFVWALGYVLRLLIRDVIYDKATGTAAHAERSLIHGYLLTRHCSGGEINRWHES